MATLSIGVSTRSLRQPLRRALATARELGADGVEIDLRSELSIQDFSQTALREFRKLLSDLGLTVLAAAFPTRRGLDEPEGLDRRVRAIAEAMTFAFKLGARTVVGRGGELAGEEPSPTLVEALTALAAHGERAGARFAIASGAAPAAQLRLIERVGAGGVGLALHPGLLLAGGFEPAAAASTLGGHTLHAYATDAVRDPSIAGGGVTEVPLGRGDADPPALLAALAEHDYRGAVTVQRLAGDDPQGDCRQAIAYLRAL